MKQKKKLAETRPNKKGRYLERNIEGKSNLTNDETYLPFYCSFLLCSIHRFHYVAKDFTFFKYQQVHECAENVLVRLTLSPEGTLYNVQYSREWGPSMLFKI
jgi:hypothetical protein